MFFDDIKKRKKRNDEMIKRKIFNFKTKLY